MNIHEGSYENGTGAIPKRPCQRGAVLVMVLVCLLVVATIGSLLARQMIGEQRQLRRQEDQVQAFWIAESAVQRGRAQEAASDDYTGETWSLDGETLGRKRSAEVKIQTPAAAESAADSMHIEVRLQVGAGQFTQRRDVSIRPAKPVE